MPRGAGEGLSGEVEDDSLRLLFVEVDYEAPTVCEVSGAEF